MKKIINIPCFYDSPWDNIDERYQLLQQVEGTIKAKSNHSIIIELEKGIYGLLQIANLSPMSEDLLPLNKEDKIKCVVLGINKKSRVIYLRQASEIWV